MKAHVDISLCRYVPGRVSLRLPHVGYPGEEIDEQSGLPTRHLICQRHERHRSHSTEPPGDGSRLEVAVRRQELARLERSGKKLGSTRRVDRPNRRRWRSYLCHVPFAARLRASRPLEREKGE